jgi:hypothetical protein
MRKDAMSPEAKVKTEINQIAARKPKTSAVVPANSAPTA